MKKISWVLFIVVAFLLVAVDTLSTSAKSSNLCSQCHSSYSQYLDILENNNSEVIPTTLGVGESKTVTILISNQCNALSHTTLTNVRLTLSSKNGYFTVTNPTYTVGTMSVGIKSVTWQINGKVIGLDEVTVTAQGYNAHNHLTFEDTYAPAKTITVTSTAPPPKYLVKVIVKDSTTSNPLQGANVSLGGSQKTTISNGSAAFSLPAGDYPLEISMSGYTTIRETIKIYGPTAITRSLSLVPSNSYMLKIIIKDTNANPISSANISIAGIIALTDESGQASFNLKPGEYSVQVSKQGYSTISETLTLATSASLSRTLTPTPPELFPVKVIVTDSLTQEPINDANVTLNGGNQQTDKDGVASFKLKAGGYLLEIAKYGYISYAENVSITEKTNIERALDLDEALTSPPIMVYIHPPIAITAYLLIFTFATLIYSNVGNRIIPWIGFSAWIFSIIGMVTGMIWAETAWGSYWSWEPRESSSLIITVLVSFMMISYLEKWPFFSRLFAMSSCIAIIISQQTYFLAAGIFGILIVIALRLEVYLAFERPKRYSALMKLNRDLSWVLIIESTATLMAGYIMTRLGADPSISLPIHTYLGYAFIALLLSHIVLSFTYPYPWIGYLRALKHGLSKSTLMGLIQESSAILLILLALAQFTTGISWLNPILANFIPLRLHVDLDNALLYILVVHGVTGIRALSIRRKLSVPGGDSGYLLSAVVVLLILIYVHYLNII